MEVKDPSPEYLRGFNRGYIVRKFTPNKEIKIQNLSEHATGYARGFNDGVDQYEHDISKTFDQKKGAFNKDLRQDRFEDRGR